MRDTNPLHLHPVLREKLLGLTAKLFAEGLPFRLFEGYRGPARQAELYAQGRMAPGRIVTKARPWQSFHQYGLAVDMVLWLDEGWSWSTAGPLMGKWHRFHELARIEGLEPLSFELPHIQLSGLMLEQFRLGHYPAGGDAEWGQNLASEIRVWSGTEKAPAEPIFV